MRVLHATALAATAHATGQAGLSSGSLSSNSWTPLGPMPLASDASGNGTSTANTYACPLYRAEITVVPGRNEMYVWYVSRASNGIPVDGEIWQSLNADFSATSATPS